MTRDELDVHYRAYIASLNERRIDDAAEFYCDELLYNGKPMSRAEWRQTAIEDSLTAMPDLRWHIEHLVIEDAYLAARLRDTGTLIGTWHGIPPSGTPVSFAEHVFYRFRGGRADEVWSVVDVLAMQASDHS